MGETICSWDCRDAVIIFLFAPTQQFIFPGTNNILVFSFALLPVFSGLIRSQPCQLCQDPSSCSSAQTYGSIPSKCSLSPSPVSCWVRSTCGHVALLVPWSPLPATALLTHLQGAHCPSNYLFMSRLNTLQRDTSWPVTLKFRRDNFGQSIKGRDCGLCLRIELKGTRFSLRNCPLTDFFCCSCVCTHRDQGLMSGCLPQSLYTSCFETEFLTEPGTHRFCQTGQ